MKRTFASFLLSLLGLLGLLVLASCGREQSFAVVLWAPPDGPLANGDQVSVVRLSEQSGLATVRSRQVKGSVELEAWRLRLASSRDQLRTEAEAYAPYVSTFAYAQRDGLPLREDPEQEARRVYKLREGQVLKVLSRGEERVTIASYQDTGTGCSRRRLQGGFRLLCRCSRARGPRGGGGLKARTRC
jgi:hypothetical protein